jgi:hypothetical protein
MPPLNLGHLEYHSNPRRGLAAAKIFRRRFAEGGSPFAPGFLTC